ncbi:MAG: sulfatase family protein [Verrucomicrobiales bacterium]
MRKAWLFIVWIAIALNAQAARPNILFIMSDDHAAHAVGAYGSKVNETPHMDRLAAEGVLFENCFVTNSICTPSRATLLTGKYSHRNGVPVFNRFDGSQPTGAKMLQAAGYHTGMIGKWHLGSDPTGFDTWEILPGQGAYNDPVFYTVTGEKTYRGRYVSHVITELSIDFLTQRPKDQPFFLMCHHKAPHRDWEPEEKYRAQFAGKAIPEPATLRDDYATRTDALRENRQTVRNDFTRNDLKLAPPSDLKPGTPAYREWLQGKPEEAIVETDGEQKTLRGEDLSKWKYQRYMRDYLACVQSVDDSIGQLLDYLKAHQLEQNTLVIYTADNGFFLGDHGMYDKRFMYEHSLRIPLLARWPAAARTRHRAKELVINTDFAPTFLEVAGLPVPAEMQGRSLLPLLIGDHPPDWRSSFYYRYYHDPGHHHTARHAGVRTQTHKLIHFWKKDQWELFDLVSDPDELKNLYGQPEQESTTAALKAEMLRLKKELKDDDQFAVEFPPPGVDGTVAKLRGK